MRGIHIMKYILQDQERFEVAVARNPCMLRHVPDNLKTQDMSQPTFVLMKTSWRRLSSSSSEDVLIKMNMFALALRLQKTSWSRPIYSSWLYVFKTSSRRFQDVFKTSCKNVFKTSSRRLQDVFKTSSRRLEKRLQDIFKTSSRRTIKLNCSC